MITFIQKLLYVHTTYTKCTYRLTTRIMHVYRTHMHNTQRLAINRLKTYKTVKQLCKIKVHILMHCPCRIMMFFSVFSYYLFFNLYFTYILSFSYKKTDSVFRPVCVIYFNIMISRCIRFPTSDQAQPFLWPSCTSLYIFVYPFIC